MSTRETILAGRETDQRIAAEVLGWTHLCNVEGALWGSPPGCDYDTNAPQWSERDGSALEVVEALCRRGWLVVLKAMPDGLPFLAGAGWGPGEAGEIRVRYIAEGQWTRRPECGEPLRGLVARQVGMADALALAVCRLALKCVRAEREAE